MSEREALRSELSDDLNENVGALKRLLNAGVNSDAQFRPLRLSGIDLCVVYIEGMADDKKLSDFVLRACNDLGISTVAIYSKEDIYSAHRTKADLTEIVITYPFLKW